jgi:hypothetical protein
MTKVETNERLAELHGLLVDERSEWDISTLALVWRSLEQRLRTEQDRYARQEVFKINGFDVT